jgi:hypothetical protein
MYKKIILTMIVLGVQATFGAKRITAPDEDQSANLVDAAQGQDRLRLTSAQRQAQQRIEQAQNLAHQGHFLINSSDIIFNQAINVLGGQTAATAQERANLRAELTAAAERMDDLAADSRIQTVGRMDRLLRQRAERLRKRAGDLAAQG